MSEALELGVSAKLDAFLKVSHCGPWKVCVLAPQCRVHSMVQASTPGCRMAFYVLVQSEHRCSTAGPRR
eukprot:3126055-Amphidinium_carterae.4